MSSITRKQVFDAPQITALKSDVYENIKKIAANNKLVVENAEHEGQYPVSDAREHQGLETPKDYRLIGNLEVVQHTASKSFYVGFFGNDRNLENDNNALSIIEAAFKSAGANILEKKPAELIQYGVLRAQFPANVSFEKGLEALADQLSLRANSLDTKLKVADAIAAIAEKDGVMVQNLPNQPFPENDGLEHVYSFKTPEDYIVKGSVEVVQHDKSGTFVVNVYNFRKHPEIERAVTQAMQEAGLDPKVEKGEYTRIVANATFGQDVEQIRLKLLNELEKQVGKENKLSMKVETDVSVWQAFNSVYRFVSNKELEASERPGFTGPTFPITNDIRPGIFSQLYDKTLRPADAKEALSQVVAVKGMFEHFQTRTDVDPVQWQNTDAPAVIKKLDKLEADLKSFISRSAPQTSIHEASQEAGVARSQGQTRG